MQRTVFYRCALSSLLSFLAIITSYGQAIHSSALNNGARTIADSTMATPVRSISPGDSGHLAQIHRYYALGKQYREGNGVAIDYNKAFSYFSQAAALGDAQSIYATAYMRYKGLGTTQDYTTAAQLFAQGAYAGRDNSMYFYGLCLRNGYGITQNEDSAQYWLKKAASSGYKQAIQELRTKTPENSNTQARQLVQKIHNAALPQQTPLNKFIALQPQIPDSAMIAGDYEGYVIQYDWSGRNVISSKLLVLSLNAAGGNAVSANVAVSNTDGSGNTTVVNNISGRMLLGKWMEEGTDSVNVKASFIGDSLVFDSSVHYGRKDHYSPDSAVLYNFKNAALNIVRKGDSVYLAGNIYMFSPARKEPSKPLFVALVRMDSPSDSSLIKKQPATGLNDSAKAAAKLLSVYPNPFRTYVNVQFVVNTAGNVGVELYNMAGQKVYEKPKQFLNVGQYSIRVEPSSQLPAQTYLLRLVFTNGQQSASVIKM